jgi:hypothetical protein
MDRHDRFALKWRKFFSRRNGMQKEPEENTRPRSKHRSLVFSSAVGDREVVAQK